MPETLHRSANTETRRVPAAAFEFSAPCELTVGDRQDGLSPITLLARSPEPIDHWYWGKLVHDLDGMQHPSKIALDYCHDQYEPLGFGDQFSITEQGLTVSGSVVHHREGDLADKITHKAKNGVPFEASIYFSSQPDDLRIEFIPEGAFAEANGREYEGPVFIARESFLRGLAVCLYGYDRHTQSRLSSDPDRTVNVAIEHPGALMSNKHDRTKLTDDVDSADTDKSGDAGSQADAAAKEGETAKPANADETTSGTESSPASEDAATAGGGDAGTLTRSELKHYIDAFGPENGSKWALEGKSLSECHQLNAAHLRSELATSRQETEQLKQKLASLSTGEDDPAKFSPDVKDATTGDQPPAPISELAANVGPNIARIAAGIKIPTS